MTKEKFFIGQIFKGAYPPEAAEWCNGRGDCFIDEIDAVDDVRRFEIKLIPEPSEEELKQREIVNIKSQLNALDLKRIRAMVEPCVKDELTGETWLEYYNSQVVKLREELKRLEN